MSTAKKIIAIRPLQKSDRKLLARYANNKNIRKGLRDIMPFPYLEEDADNFIEVVSAQDPTSTFAITLNKRFVGVCGINFQTDIYRKSCEVGYWVAEPFWGLGVATIALNLLTEYAFAKLNLVRTYTGVFDYNLASQKVLEKAGYVKEGFFKKALIKDGKFYDEVRYARVR